MSDYYGSIAQEEVSFSTALALTTAPGDNYFKLMVFVGVSQADESLVGAHAAKELIELTSANFAELTIGALKDWLTAFYAKQSNIKTYIVVFVDKVLAAWDPAGLIAAFGEYAHLAYWKAMMYYPEVGDIPTLTEQDSVAYIALATLQKANANLSAPILVNEYDSDVFTSFATTLSGLIAAEDLDAFSVYHATAMLTAPAFAQLGITLGFLNVTGTPVGNSLDYVATNAISASGVAGINLTPTQQGQLRANKVGFFKTVGNGTGQVALIGGISLQNSVVAAEWIVQYNDYVCEIRTAEIITQMNSFKNRSMYSTILALLEAQLSKFGDTGGLGRLTQVRITAPAFNRLPTAPGDTFLIPNAWSATYVDNVRTVQVQGSLTIQA